MLETALITFREGLEAFLIVFITLAYLQKTGRQHLAWPVYAGIAVALLVSIGGGFALGEMTETPAMEGTLALVAGALVASMTVYVMKTAKFIRQSIHAQIDRNAQKAGLAAAFGVFAFTVMMIAREGMETAMMIGALSEDMTAQTLLSGVAAGLAMVALIGFAWIKKSHLINLKIFLQVTGVFLVLFSLHLFVYGFHEMTEGGLVPFIDNGYWHYVTESVDGDQPLGMAITYSLAIVPCAWLVFAVTKDWLARRAVVAAAAAE